MQAVYRGEATPDQQRLAIEFIVGKLSEADEMTFRSEPDGGLGSAFAEGRRFVGSQIARIIKTPISKYSAVKPNPDKDDKNG